MARKKVKRSLGLICYTEDNTKVLMIKKRYSYAFCDFIHGKYNSNDLIRLSELFNKMTVEEKLDILTFDFKYLWRKVWLDKHKNSKLYHENRYKFDSTFSYNTRINLRKLINESKSIDLEWELPKGRREKKESELECAVREFREETNVTKCCYTLIPGFSIVDTVQDDNVIYKSKYYLCKINTDINPKVRLKNIKQCEEISCVKWIEPCQIKNKKIYKLCKKSRKYLKNNNL